MLRVFRSFLIITLIFVDFFRSEGIIFASKTNSPEFCSSGFCFTINKTNKTFSDAEAQCRTSGRSLLIVSNKAEQEFLLNTIQRVLGQSIRLWFGLHSVFDRYQWVSGSQFVANTYFATPPAAVAGNCFTVHAGTSIYTWAPERCDERLWFLCGNFSEVKVTATDSSKRVLGCPSQYHLLDGACFLPKVSSEDQLTWDEAARVCRKLENGSLATISSLIQQDFLSLTLSNSSIPVWIGLQLVDGEHRWINQANITFTKWIKRQPTGGAQNKCAMAHRQKQRLGEWEDVDCSMKMGYICQAPPTALPMQTSPGFLPAQGRCRKDFIEFQGRCYRFDSRLTSQTEEAAAKLGQEICPFRVSPRSPGELALMRLLANAQTAASLDPVWIGMNLTYNVSDAAKVKLLAEDHLPVWGSSPLDFGNIPMISSSQNTLEKSTLSFFCVALSRNSSDFIWMNCSASLPSMCGYPLSDYEISSPSHVTTCPTGWSRLGNRCYSPVNNTVDTWAGAEDTCQSLHNESHLLSLHNSTDQLFVGELFSGARGWLGLRVQAGSSANGSLRFQWADGSPIDFLPFKLDELLSEQGSGDPEQCIVLRDETHDWARVSCYDRHVFICQLTLSNQAPPPAASVSSGKPTDGSNTECSTSGLFPYMCIELRTTPRVFWIAQEECRAMGKTLVTIPSKDHQRFVMDYLRKKAGGTPLNIFVGLFSSAGRWRWVSDYHSLPSTFWSANHPEQENQCVFVDTSAEGLNTWKSGPCEVSLPFLCGTALQSPEPVGIDFTTNACPQSYLQIGSSCFSIHAGPQDKTTWNHAAEQCRASGATLATISSLHEQDGLAALLALQSQSAWIGFRLEDGHHSWVRSGPVIFTNWGKGQPAGRGSRCTFMNRHFTALGDWGDAECDTLMGYICQVDPVPLKSPKVIPELDDLFKRGRCADGYYEYRNQCFAIYDEMNPRSTTELHDDVSGQCLRMVHFPGANCGTSSNLWGTAGCPVVATPHTYADAAFLRVLLSRFSFHSKSAWVGLKIRKVNGTLQPNSEDGSLLGASALIAFESASIASSDRQDSTDSRYDCIVASTLDTQLHVVDCDQSKLPAICSYFLDDHVLHHKNRMLSAEKCPPDWSFFGGKCYAMIPAHERKDWIDAEKTCNAFTIFAHSTSEVPIVGHLVSVHSLEEQHHLFDLAGNASLWLGLYLFYEPSSGQPASTNANRSVHLAWTDESPVDYVAFALNPSTLGMNQMRCFTIDGDKSQWHPVECFQKRNFICQLSYPVDMDDPVSTVPSVQTDDVVKCDRTFPLTSKSNKGCYRILQSPSTWVTAEKACRSLSTGAHLASVHNQEELNELIDVISRELKEKVNVWVGLYESDLAYQWSDGSAVQFIPLSADLSKDARHLSQDCFVLSPNNDTNSKSPYSLRAVDCSSSQPFSVCKSPSTNATALRVDDLSQWKLMLCPPGYRQYADRCFSILAESTTWAEGSRRCSEQASQFNGYSGSLARIDSPLVQEFVASLLDDLPPKISSAWIGLQQNISSDNSTVMWSDGSQVHFLRSIYRESVQGIFGNSAQLQMCTALYRSTYPRLNGLWLQWSCDKPILLASVCQASPPSVPREESKPVSYNCPTGFLEGTTGFSPGGQRISQPVCYRLLSTNEKFSWEDSSDRCKRLSTPGHNVSLLSIASVFEASFIRAWLRLPRAMGGAGLPADEPVWSGLRVANNCPDCYRNWSWDTVDSAPVRFTDWLSPPSPTPSGCYIFHPNPYTRRESLSDSGLGSLQLAGSCDLTYFAVCQTLANEPVEKQGTSGPVAPITHQAVRPKCFTFDAHSSDKLFLTNVSQSHSGRPCIRWDLVPQNLTEFRLESNWLRHRLHVTEVVGGDGFASYAENYCSVLYLVSLKDYKYECYVGLNPPTVEECDLMPCPHVLRRSYLLGPATTAFIVILLLIAVAILAVGLWRGHAPLRSGYRRYFSPTRFTSNRMQRSSVQFVPPDTVSCIQTSHVNNGTNGYFGAAHNPSTKASPEKITSSDHSRLLQNQLASPTNGVSNGVAYIYTPPAAKPELAQTGFINPIYAPHDFLVPEDDYDPEADI